MNDSMPRSVTRTLRIDPELDKAIGRRASNDRVSVNFLVNRCIRRFVEWDALTAQFGMVTVPRLVLSELAGGKDTDAIERLGRMVARNFLEPAATYSLGTFDVASAIEMLRRSSTYGGRFSFDVGDGHDSHSHVIVIRHDEGWTWSRYYVGLLDEAFRVILGKDTKITFTDALCVAQLGAP